MREVSFKDEFDACVILPGSFGFFDDEGNLRVLQIMEQALKRRGRFYIHGPDPLRKMKEGWKGWDEVEGGYVLMRSDYDPKTGRIIDAFFYITDAGELVRYMPTPEDKGFSLETRMYTLPEIIALIETAGLRSLSAYGSIELPPEPYALTSSSMIVVGEKP
jgi:SAM-dependent methyltransferase